MALLGILLIIDNQGTKCDFLHRLYYVVRGSMSVMVGQSRTYKSVLRISSRHSS